MSGAESLSRIRESTGSGCVVSAFGERRATVASQSDELKIDVVKMRVDGYTWAQIATEHKITVEEARNIVREWMRGGWSDESAGE
jgi:hypothetical protein